ncbi:unnamed protein product [Heterotrigona itama]|uniref:Uncharacterized protein n=1 Tax=Heterotrigona itama TaxID=395501 RepID=A0A6V7HEG7_9HYME|nr:unnamed protein product [Heterotrigona itama]
MKKIQGTGSQGKSWDHNGPSTKKLQGERTSATELNELNARTGKLARRNNRVKDREIVEVVPWKWMT